MIFIPSTSLEVYYIHDAICLLKKIQCTFKLFSFYEAVCTIVELCHYNRNFILRYSKFFVIMFVESIVIIVCALCWCIPTVLRSTSSYSRLTLGRTSRSLCIWQSSTLFIDTRCASSGCGSTWISWAWRLTISSALSVAVQEWSNRKWTYFY